MDFDIKIPVRVISGKDCLKNNALMLRTFGNKCIIVTGGKSALLSGALDDMKYGERWVKNASLAYITYEDGKFTVDSFNNTEHLNGLITQLQHNV